MPARQHDMCTPVFHAWPRSPRTHPSTHPPTYVSRMAPIPTHPPSRTPHISKHTLHPTYKQTYTLPHIYPLPAPALLGSPDELGDLLGKGAERSEAYVNALPTYARVHPPRCGWITAAAMRASRLGKGGPASKGTHACTALLLRPGEAGPECASAALEPGNKPGCNTPRPRHHGDKPCSLPTWGYRSSSSRERREVGSEPLIEVAISTRRASGSYSSPVWRIQGEGDGEA